MSTHENDEFQPKKAGFGDLSTGTKLKLLGLLIAVAAIAALAPNAKKLLGVDPPQADLAIEDVGVSDDGYANRVDLFVANHGDERAVITRAWIEVLDELRAPETADLPEQSDREIRYDITVRLGDEETAKHSANEYGEQIAPHGAERLAFNLATEDSGSPPLIAYKGQFVLAYNGTSEVRSPTFIIPSPASVALTSNGETSAPAEWSDQLAAIADWLNDPGARSGPAVDGLLKSVQQAQ